MTKERRIDSLTVAAIAAIVCFVETFIFIVTRDILAHLRQLHSVVHLPMYLIPALENVVVALFAFTVLSKNNLRYAYRLFYYFLATFSAFTAASYFIVSGIEKIQNASLQGQPIQQTIITEPLELVAGIGLYAIAIGLGAVYASHQKIRVASFLITGALTLFAIMVVEPIIIPLVMEVQTLPLNNTNSGIMEVLGFTIPSLAERFSGYVLLAFLARQPATKDAVVDPVIRRRILFAGAVALLLCVFSQQFELAFRDIHQR